MAENMIKFLRGNVASLPATATAGAVYFTKDEGLYLGLEDGTYHRYGDFITVANVAALPEAGAHETCMYYCEEENILAKWSGTAWIQINKQKTLAELGGVAKSVYEAKVAALEAADSANADAIAGLTTYVGAIPNTSEATDVIGYIQEKTAGIATDAALGELQEDLGEAQAAIKALQDANAEGGVVANAIADAQAAAEAAQATADSKTTMAEVEAKGYQTAEQVQAIANGKDAAIQAAQDKADSAYTLAEGKATMAEVNEAIAGAGHAVKSEVDATIAAMDEAYKAADTALETKLQGKIDEKVAQSAYDEKIGALEGADATLQGNIEAEAKARKDADDAQVERIVALEGQITGLTGAMHFKGVENAIPEGEEALAGYVDGDVILVGEKEYVFNDGAFVEFGDVSAEGERIAALEGLVGKEAEGENAATGLIKGVADNAAAIVAEKARAEAKEAELAAADATNLQAAQDYADDAVEALGIADYVKKADADLAYAAAGHNHDDKYDAKGDAAQALVDAKAHADSLNEAMDERVKVVEGKAHEHANKALLDTYTQTEENLADAVAKKHEHANAAELAKIVDGDVAKWNGAQAAAEATAAAALGAAKSELEGKINEKASATDVYAKTETYTKE